MAVFFRGVEAGRADVCADVAKAPREGAAPSRGLQTTITTSRARARAFDSAVNREDAVGMDASVSMFTGPIEPDHPAGPGEPAQPDDPPSPGPEPEHVPTDPAG